MNDTDFNTIIEGANRYESVFMFELAFNYLNAHPNFGLITDDYLDLWIRNCPFVLLEDCPKYDPENCDWDEYIVLLKEYINGVKNRITRILCHDLKGDSK